MSECGFNQEGFCITEEKCGSAKGKLKVCTAKNEDLIEICPDCYQPTNDCGCGTTWVLVKDSRGKVVAITPKEYKKLLKEVRV
ncbi:hypothetical protein MUP01_10920 [Candidatus Bathyarchaeota archaeon]|nr:hypothetical protein [Candidatus Bathyarchaeota archaeon]